MIIYGAGMAGLLAANMLRRHRPIIHEIQPELPHNHDALLRFRTDAVSRVTGIPFKKVTVTKAIQFEGKLHTTTNIRLNNLYSIKVTGEVHPRSMANLEPAERYIAPPNFIAQMASSCSIIFNSGLDTVQGKSTPFISTVPMPAMMKLVDWPNKPEFKFKSIWIITADIIKPITEVYQTIYYPSPEESLYRASITGNRCILELIAEPSSNIQGYLLNVLQDFGLGDNVVTSPAQVTHQYYGKLLPIDDHQRRAFIMALTDQYGIYSIGRFATWRQLLMDDVVNDVHHINAMIEERDLYRRRLQQEGATAV